MTVPAIALATAGDWLVKLKVNYLHGSTTSDPDGDGLYEAVAEQTINVTSVAAAFTVTPPVPLNTQAISLNGSASKPVGGNLGFFWEVNGPTVYSGCPAQPTCSIPADTLAWGSYTIKLTVTNLDDNEDSTATKTVAVGNGAIQPTFTWAPGSPDIGQIATFNIGGVEVGIDKATWNMGGTGCDGASATQVCTAGQYSCDAQAFKYATSGNKIVSLTIEVGGVSYTDERPAAERTVTVANSGSCGGTTPPRQPAATASAPTVRNSAPRVAPVRSRCRRRRPASGLPATTRPGSPSRRAPAAPAPAPFVTRLRATAVPNAPLPSQPADGSTP